MPPGCRTTRQLLRLVICYAGVRNQTCIMYLSFSYIRQKNFRNTLWFQLLYQSFENSATIPNFPSSFIVCQFHIAYGCTESSSIQQFVFRNWTCLEFGCCQRMKSHQFLSFFLYHCIRYGNQVCCKDYTLGICKRL